MEDGRLECRGLSKELASGSHRLAVLTGIDLSVEPGEFVAILGPSGSGKTTLLGLLAGLDRPSAGEVRLGGRRIDDLSEDQLARLRRARVGFVFQSFQLLGNLTALENVLLPLELTGVPRARERATELLGEVGLAERLEHYPSQLSGGEQQRVALARAFAPEPSVLFADEPTGNLDAETGARVLALLQRLRDRRGATLVLVTHDPEVAARADRRVHLRAGRIERVETGVAGARGERPAVRLGAIPAAARRESRGARGRLVFFTACLALGSMAVVGVSGLVASVRAGIAAQSKELLGADLWIRSRSPLPDDVEGALLERLPEGSRVAPVRLVQTMARAAEGGGSRLVELKAVGAGFPFHGAMRLEPPGTLDATLDDESVVLASELGAMLGVRVGDEVALGSARFEVAAFVLDEPGRLDPTFTAGPRVFSTLAGFERMQLGGIGSRMTYGALVALSPQWRAADWEGVAYEAVLGAYRPPKDDDADAGFRVDTHEEAQPQVRRAAERVERYLGLVALLSLILAGVGVAEIVRAWIATRVASVGVLRVLGFTPTQVLWTYAAHIAALALFGSALGAVAGSFLPLLVPHLMPELLPSGIELAWSPGSILRGVALGTLVALAFSLPALSSVWRVPPVRVLRHEAEPLPPRRAVAALAFAALAGSVWVAAWVQSGEPDQAAWFSAGFALLFGLFALAARGLTRLARVLPRRGLPPSLAAGIAALARPGAGVLGAVASLGVATLVVVTLVLVETRLAERLQSALPEDGPTLFFLDLQVDQREAFERVLAQGGADSVRVVPLATARLSSIGGAGVGELVEERERRDRDGRGRGRWALTREQRLTWAAELGEDNRIVAGELWSDPKRLEISLEEDYAADIGAELGSVLAFDLSGVELELVVTSLREVEWESFGINFFLVAEPGALDDAPHALLASARVPPGREQRVQDALLAEVPNVTVIPVRAMLEKVSRVLERSALAVEVLGAFTAAVALAILAGVAGLGALRRTREAALWKVLGVTRGGVARLFALEFALVGLAGGLLGALGACALAWAVFEHVLELGSDVPVWTAPVAALAVAALAALAGLAACARALAARPIESLRG